MTMLTTKFLTGRGIPHAVDENGCIRVGGSLDLEGCTGITALPDGLTVGGSLYLRGTGITALPDGLTVGGSLDLEGCTGITALPDGLTVGGSLYYDGDLSGHSFAIFDGITCVVVSSRQRDDIEILRCRKSQFKAGKLVGDLFFVARSGETNAHGDTAREAVGELIFKRRDRDVEQYRGMALDTAHTPTEWVLIYREITGACRFGTQDFMARQGKLKRRYTLAEVLKLTANAYGGSTFREVVGGRQ